MKIYLAGMESGVALFNKYKPPFVLYSYFSANDGAINYSKSNFCKDYLLDSGAFSFLNSRKVKASNFDDYVKKYADFINDNDVKKYFELDIDPIVGLKKVEEYRRYLERNTNGMCIPVWHVSRGKEYFLRMCKEREYVAIGGIVTKEIPRKSHNLFGWFCDVAHKHNCMIHGLGFTNVKLLTSIHWDSVDSTSWNRGSKYGLSNRFEVSKGVVSMNSRLLRDEFEGMRLKNSNILDEMNLQEWIKLQRYAERYL